MLCTGLHDQDVLVMPEPVYFGGTVYRTVGTDDIVCEITARPKGLCASRPGRLRRRAGHLARHGDRIVVMGARDDLLSAVRARASGAALTNKRGRVLLRSARSVRHEASVLTTKLFCTRLRLSAEGGPLRILKSRDNRENLPKIICSFITPSTIVEENRIFPQHIQARFCARTF